MNFFHKFLYNLDRAGASLLNAPPQETISSQVGRALNANKGGIKPILAKLLNWIDPGHTDRAIAHADALNHADSEAERIRLERKAGNL